MERTLLAVFLMALVSYLPRVTPLVFLRQKIKSPFIQSFLLCTLCRLGNDLSTVLSTRTTSALVSFRCPPSPSTKTG